MLRISTSEKQRVQFSLVEECLLVKNELFNIDSPDCMNILRLSSGIRIRNKSHVKSYFLVGIATDIITECYVLFATNSEMTVRQKHRRPVLMAQRDLRLDS